MFKQIGGGRPGNLYQHRFLPTSDNLIQVALFIFAVQEMAEEKNLGLCFCGVSAMSRYG